ncbi:MotA/TolQ/ExbB proton channel family protein [Salinisphaera sp. PC39]|uniref:MotA/TolQ/ExbB proton channel family protein n=1 Tax=Salinisphaera sp. PC39 TaxID=1304156 RepID=UPI0033421875
MNAQALPSFDLFAAGELLALGGPVVGVLAILSVFALAIVLLKCWQFHSVRIGDRDFVEPTLDAWRAGRTDEALAELARRHNPIAATLSVVLRGRRAGIAETTVREEAARVGALHLAELRGYLRPLELIGTLSPLLGLLGTVLGMIEAFRALESAGNRVDPAILSGGIWEALLTTAIGLIVAIPAVAAFNWLERRIERLHQDMQDAVTRAFTVEAFGPQETVSSEPAGVAAHAH